MSRAGRRLPPSLASIFVLTLGLSGQARAANPAFATYSHDSSRLFWLLHVSDFHSGQEVFDEEPKIRWLLGEGVQVIAPNLVVVTGDLVDASPNGIPTMGQDPDEWDLYREMVDDAGMNAGYYMDLLGNHDAYGDEGSTWYLSRSIIGETYGTTSHAEVLSFAFGDYLVYGIATPGDDGATMIEHPELSGAELTEMGQVLDDNDGAKLAFVFGHHALSEIDQGDQARWLLEGHGAHYFHGHRHRYTSYLAGTTLVNHEVDSLGEDNVNNVAVIAVDNDAVSYAVTSSEDPWPLITITAPNDRLLTSGAEDPFAYQICQTGTENPVRALIFDVAPITAVTLSAGGQAPVGMWQDPNEPRLWHGRWDTTTLPPGDTTLTITATGTQARSREVTVRVGDVTCPAVLPPDAAPVDAGTPFDAPLEDGASSTSDAGAAADASATAADAGEGDAGVTPAEDDPGCGCRALGGRGPARLPTWPVVVLGAGLWFRARARRCGDRSATRPTIHQ